MAKRETTAVADVLDSPESTAEAESSAAAPLDAATEVLRWLALRGQVEQAEASAVAALSAKKATGGRPLGVNGRFWTVNRAGRVVEVEVVA